MDHGVRAADDECLAPFQEIRGNLSKGLGPVCT